MATNSMVSSLLPMTSINLRRRNRSTGLTLSCSVQEATSSGVQLTEGEGKLPKILLKSASGCEAEIYLFGGCVTSWKVASGKDFLFVRPDAKFDGKKPISGGIPHCFPQFGPGPIQQHGFARNMNWSIVNFSNVEENPIITLELRDSLYSRSMWDFSFQALYTVKLNPKSLSTELMIKNTDTKPFSFTTALHTYFSSSITGASVKALKGCKSLNKAPDPNNPVEGIEDRVSLICLAAGNGRSSACADLFIGHITSLAKDMVTFPGYVECVYLDAPNELQLYNGLGDAISIKNTNWSDCVLWNPHLQMEHCYKDFVCVENAKLGKVQLEPEQSWIAEQHLSIS